MSRRVVLVRHGSLNCKHQGRFVGSTDLPLSEEGRLESTHLADAVTSLMASKFFASPLRRARETARAALGPSSADVIVDPDLREVDFGRWEGMRFEETRALDPAAVERWARGEADFAFPGGERVADFVERTRAVGARLAADDADTIMAFTHGGVIRHLICHYLGLLDPRHPLMFDVRYASLAIIELHDGRGVLTGLGLVSTRRD